MSSPFQQLLLSGGTLCHSCSLSSYLCQKAARRLNFPNQSSLLSFNTCFDHRLDLSQCYCLHLKLHEVYDAYAVDSQSSVSRSVWI